MAKAKTLAGIRGEFERTSKSLTEFVRIEMLKSSIDLAAAVKYRVQQNGLNSTGNKFSPYSDTKVPLFFYKNAPARVPSAFARLEAKLKAGKKEGKDAKVSYKDWRIANNLKVDKKNFEFTGQMWANFGTAGSVRAQIEGGNIIRLIIEGGNADAKKKLAVTSWREKRSIIEPSESELKTLQSELSNAVEFAINKAING